MKRLKSFVNIFLNASRRDIVAMLKMLTPLLLVLGIAAHFSDFVVSAIEANRAINGLIIITIIYGTSLIMSRLISAQSDFSVIERFGLESASGRSMTEILEEPWIRHRYVRHYLKHVAALEIDLSSEVDHGAIEGELHALSTEYNAKLELPQFLVGFMIALGLLGTFIGLLETLTGISGMLDGMGGGDADPSKQFMALVTELKKPLAGMGIAFSASMFGLIGSLVLAIMMINLRRFISRVLMCARNVMHDITEIRRKDLASKPRHRRATDEPAPSVRQQGVASVQQTAVQASQNLSPASQDATIMLASRMDMLISKLDVLFKSFEASINGTNRMNELFGFGPRMKETAERTLEEMKMLVNNSSEQNMLAHQLADSQTTQNASLSTLLDIQRRSQAEFVQSMKVLVERLSALDESNISNGRHLWEIRESFSKMASSSGMVEMIASSVGRQALLTEALVEETREMRHLFGNSTAG